MRTWLLVVIGAVATVSLSGCNVVRAIQAWAKPKTDFYACTTDTRIICEPGSEALARAIAPFLPKAVEAVVQYQFVPFSQPIVIYTYATRESYSAHTGQSKESAGSAVLGTVNISSKLLEQPARVQRILTHELSHLHLQLQVGNSSALGNIPGWFSEGLAVLVSNGGGAENVSSEAALEAISQGRHFVPESSRSWLFPKNASSYGLDAHMYYRQASLFVGFMRDENPPAWESLIKAIATRIEFADAVQTAYGKSLGELWNGFVAKVKSNTRVESDSLRRRFAPPPLAAHAQRYT